LRRIVDEQGQQTVLARLRGRKMLAPTGPEQSFVLRPHTCLVFAAACLTIVLFALTPATTRLAAMQVDGLSIGIIRAAGGGIVAFPLLLMLRLRPPQKLRHWGLLLLSAFGSFAAFPVLFSLGTQNTSGTHAALIMAAMPLFVSGTAMLLDRRLPRPSWFVGAALAVAGEAALVALSNARTSGGSTVSGDATVLASCILFAFGVVGGARLSSHINPLAATLWAITISSVALAPLAAVHLLTATYDFQELTPTTWLALVHLTVATIIANFSWLWALSRGGLVRVAPVQFAQPVCALFFAAALLGERLSPLLLVVAAVIIFGTITACRGARPISHQETKTVRAPGDHPLEPETPGARAA
jgi:drug/metabolite transporter (DMT)-like permease